MWVDRLIQVTGAKASEGAGVETESAMKQAAQFLANGDAAAAQAVYQDVLDIDPGNAVAYAGVVRCLIASGELNRARHVFDEAPETIAKDKAFAAIRAGLELAEQGHRSAGALAELEMRLKTKSKRFTNLVRYGHGVTTLWTRKRKPLTGCWKSSGVTAFGTKTRRANNW